MKNLFLSMLLLIAFTFFLANVGEAVIPCSSVTVKAASCLSFTTGKDSVPSGPCCTGLQQLASSVKSVDDKKTICRCLKAAVKSIPNVQDKYLSQIPTACKIKVGFPVSLATNCEGIH